MYQVFQKIKEYSIGNSYLDGVGAHSSPWVKGLKRIRETSPVAIFRESKWKQRSYCTIALFQMHPSKASPFLFLFLFFFKYCHIVGVDVSNAVIS